MTSDTIAFYALACVAVCLVGLSKGGFQGLSALATPLLAIVAGPVKAAAILLPVLIVQDTVSMWAFRKTVSKRVLAIALPSGAIGIALAYLFAARTPLWAVELLLGGLCTATGLYRFWVDRRGPIRSETPAAPGWGVIAGLASGFASQVGHLGGPPFQVYIVSQKLDREIMLGTSAIFFATINWLKAPPYFALGQFDAETLITSAILAPLAVASTMAGVWMVRRLDGERYYKLIYLAMVAVGAKLIFDGVAAFAPLEIQPPTAADSRLRLAVGDRP